MKCACVYCTVWIMFSNASRVLLVCVPHCAIPVTQDEPGPGEIEVMGPTVSCRLREHYVNVGHGIACMYIYIIYIF